MDCNSNHPHENPPFNRLNGKECESVVDLHKALRRFNLRQDEYYESYYPRKDLLTGEIIKFKTYDSYFVQDFLNKNNLKKWLQTHKVEGEKWAVNWLKRRKASKRLIYAPSQTELKTLVCPTTKYYDSIGGYYTITKELGFKDRYNETPLKFSPIDPQCKIIIDSREQKPVKFKRDTVVAGMKVADYALEKAYDQGIYLERKSIADFVGTLGKGLARFEKELLRAVQTNSYIVMIVECTIQDALSFDYLPHMRYSKASPSHIFHGMRELLAKYPLTFQVLFVDGRVEMAEKIMKIFELGSQAKTVDLQYRYEKGEL